MAFTATAYREPENSILTIDYADSSDSVSGFTDINLRWLTGLQTTTTPVRRTASPSREDDFLGQDVFRFFYKWGGTFSSVLVRLRGRYDGDLDQFLIHLVFMLTELAGVNAANEARAKGAATVIVRRRGLNALSLADITRIPRESVRRKLAALAERGLVEREGDGLYYLGPAADLDRFFYDLAPLFWDKTRPT